MKVFLSWSGDRSKKVAELFSTWLPCVIQAVEPWMSNKDIERGATWSTEINDQLADTGVGVVFLTKQNKSKPWILFEAGALAKGMPSSRVCTVLIDLESTDVDYPLAQFNHTTVNKEGVLELVKTINNSLKEKKLKETTFMNVFNKYWDEFITDFNTILDKTPEEEVKEERTENEMMREVLSSVRSIEKRISQIEDESFKPVYYDPIEGEVKLISQKFTQGKETDSFLEQLSKAAAKNNFGKGA